MSDTYSLVCEDAALCIWIGQGHGGDMTSFYWGEAETMERLHRFLNATRGMPLMLLCDHEFDHERIKEFEDPHPDS